MMIINNDQCHLPAHDVLLLNSNRTAPHRSGHGEPIRSAAPVNGRIVSLHGANQVEHRAAFERGAFQGFATYFFDRVETAPPRGGESV